MKYLLFSGSQEHWAKAIACSTWGVKPGSQPAKQHWSKIRSGDIAFFYANAPVQGIIGFGILKSTQKSNVRIWNTNDAEHDYECRAPFEICVHVLDGAEPSIDIGDLEPRPLVAAAMNAVKSEHIPIIWGRIYKKWHVKKPSWFKRTTVNMRKRKFYSLSKGIVIFILGSVTTIVIERLINYII